MLQPLKQVYDSRHPHFVLYARSQVEQLVGPELASKGGLKIYTTLDPDLQAAAEESVKKQVAQLGKQGAHNGAVVAVRPEDGRDRGDGRQRGLQQRRDQRPDQHGASQPRQPGSALKPFVYLTVVRDASGGRAPTPTTRRRRCRRGWPRWQRRPRAGQDPNATGAAERDRAAGLLDARRRPIMDILTEFPDPSGPYKPTNYDNKEHGLVTVRTALANSLNIPAVKALQHIGLDRFKDTMSKAGVTTLTRPDYGLSLALGGGEVTLARTDRRVCNAGERRHARAGEPDRLRARCGRAADLAGRGGARGAGVPRRERRSRRPAWRSRRSRASRRSTRSTST